MIRPVRNCLLRLTADSPDLLAIIKIEGQFDVVWPCSVVHGREV